MQAPKAPKEDPAITAARNAEQVRAESAQVGSTQGIVTADTMANQRRFGTMPGAGTPGIVSGAAASAPAPGNAFLSALGMSGISIFRGLR